MIADAVGHGAKPLGGAEAGAPTFLLDTTPEMALCREASFAPVAGVMVAATASRLARGGGAPAAWNAAVTGLAPGWWGVPSGGQHFGLVHR